MPAAELWLLLASCVACVTAAWAAARLVRRRSVKVDQWMPEALKDHTLAYSERTFRSGDDKQVVARVDRAYRGRDGLSDVDTFKALVSAGNPGIEVILANWYGDRT